MTRTRKLLGVEPRGRYCPLGGPPRRPLQLTKEQREAIFGKDTDDWAIVAWFDRKMKELPTGEAP